MTKAFYGLFNLLSQPTIDRDSMNILIAPDSFKESLSASRFCEIAKEVIEDRLPDAKVTPIPLADGGEGTMEALVTGTDGKFVSTQVTGPLGEKVQARYGILGDGRTGVVEMAESSGLPLVPVEKRNPLIATSFGTGELILDALKRGVEKIILGLGGSATNDGGAGALQALGVKFFDTSGCELERPLSGAALASVAAIDIGEIDKRLQNVELQIASDVTNPLLGENGATMTYGPQKGATEEQLGVLENALENFSRVTRKTLKNDFEKSAGSGAAGGMGFGFLSYCRAEIESGFELIAKMYGIEAMLQSGRYSLIMTGEGEINFQSVQGKLVGRLARMGKKCGVPVVAFAGGINGDVSSLYAEGLVSMSSVVPGPVTLEEAMENAEQYLHRALVDFCELWKAVKAVV